MHKQQSSFRFRNTFALCAATQSLQTPFTWALSLCVYLNLYIVVLTFRRVGSFYVTNSTYAANDNLIPTISAYSLHTHNGRVKRVLSTNI
jgi:hypothetical protein